MLLSAPARRRTALASLFTPSAFLLACAALYPTGALAQDETTEPEVAEYAAEAPADATDAEAEVSPAGEEGEVSELLAADPADASNEGISEVIAVEALEGNTEPAETLEVAEDGDAVQLEAVQVTGSRIRRTDFETSQPVLRITRDDIERTGLTAIG
ncbi:MAG TPA: hypothetical protein VFV27_11815, partial [Nevskiaceae bacterium]|nr:hypothetical protein [Nevskiaceae bacterium]